MGMFCMLILNMGTRLLWLVALFQLRNGAVVAIEADRDVEANLRGKTILLKRHQPVLSP